VVEVFHEATIFFCDIVGFTTIAKEMSPLNVMRLLNSLYTEFDELVEEHQVYKVDVVGDAYMVVGGAPEKEDCAEAAAKVAKFALSALELVAKKDGIQIRCGIASGPIVAGVVGRRMPRYDFFGDTVNTASRMETTSLPGCLQVSEATKELLLRCSDSSDFKIHSRVDPAGQEGVHLKGRGHMKTYWITASESEEPEAAEGPHPVPPEPTEPAPDVRITSNVEFSEGPLASGPTAYETKHQRNVSDFVEPEAVSPEMV